MGITIAQATSAAVSTEILNVKLTWFSAESDRLTLVLYFTLIWGVTSNAPHWMRLILANIQMKAPPRHLSLSLLIVGRQVGVPEWQLNYSLCLYMGVCLCFLSFGDCCFLADVSELSISQQCCEYILLTNLVFLSHQIYSISNPFGIKVRTKRRLPLKLNWIILYPLWHHSSFLRAQWFVVLSSYTTICKL